MLTQLILLPGLYFVFTDLDRLGVHAEPAVAVLALQESGRKHVQLPELEFRLSVSPYCAQGGRPESLSITIADSHETLRGDQLRTTGTLGLSIRVPASQLAPFALREFCVDPISEGESVLFTAALAAQVSLRCAREAEPSIVFVAEPLDIRVDCIRSAAEAAPVAD